MRKLVRVLLGVQGLLAVMTAMALWFNMAAVLPQMGIEPANLAGRASVRADIAGLFLGIGVLTILAAWYQSARWASAAMIVTLAALAGRVATIAIDGIGPATWPPILVEVVAIGLLAAGRALWRQRTL